MISRRNFLRAGTTGAVALTAFTNEGLARVAAAGARTAGVAPADVASDETYWREIQQGFTLDRTIINLNNGGCCPSPRVVHEAFKRYLDISNQSPVYHMWQILEPNIETVRRRLAAEFGCSPEEMAITRNASEALQIAQLGIDLKAGDEVVTTNQDYGRMLDTWDQRVRREGITVRKISFPVPPPSMDDLADRLISRDRAEDEGPPLLPHHQPDRTDLPGEEDLRRGAREGREDDRGRRARVRALPVQGRGSRLRLSTARACTSGCSRRSGRASSTCGARTSSRCGALTADRREPEQGHPQVRGDRHAPGREPQRDRRGAQLPRRHRHRAEVGAPALPAQPLGGAPAEDRPLQDPHADGSGAVVRHRDGAGARRADTGKAVQQLWEKWRIIATPINHAEYTGIRVTPNVYTTLEEIDTFGEAMEKISAAS